MTNISYMKIFALVALALGLIGSATYAAGITNDLQMHANGHANTTNYANWKIDAYERILQFYQNRANHINTSSGLNTSGLNQLLVQANSTILQPLIFAVNQSNGNSTQIRAALGSYCLFNGCSNGTNFHLAAKFQLQRLNLLFGKVPANYTNSTNTNTVQTDLGIASSTLATVGTSQYTGNESTTIWSNLGNAAATLRTIFQQLGYHFGHIGIRTHGSIRTAA